MTGIKLKALGPWIEQQRERWNVPGVVVGILRDGEIEKAGYGVTSLETGCPVTADTLFQIGSNSKVFTTTLLMTLVDDDAVDLDAPVTTYLPDLKLADENALRNITVRHLVSHQSGVWGDYFDDFGWGADALAMSVANMHALRQMYQPAELWAYTNSGFNLVGRIIEIVLDQPFETAMRERVLQPLGLERTFYFPQEVYAYPHAVGHRPAKPGDDDVIVAREYWLHRAINPAGGLHSTVEDVLAFDQFHLDMIGAERGEKPVLSEESRKAMQQPQIKAAGFADEWGLGWWIRYVNGVKVIGHSGGTNGFITRNTVIPDKQIAWAIYTNSAYGGAAIRPIERWLFEHVAGLTDHDPDLIEMSGEQLQHFAGEYSNPRSTSVVTARDGGLRVQTCSISIATDEEVTYPAVDFMPVGQQEFMATEGREEGVRIDFILNPDGSIRFLRMGGRLYEPGNQGLGDRG